jgi:hypothetical protein
MAKSGQSPALARRRESDELEAPVQIREGLLTRKGGRLHSRPIQAAEFAASVFNKSATVASYSDGEKVDLSFATTGGRGAIVTKTIARSGIRIEHDPDERGQVGGLTPPVRAGGLAFPIDGDAGFFLGG